MLDSLSSEMENTSEKKWEYGFMVVLDKKRKKNEVVYADWDYDDVCIKLDDYITKCKSRTTLYLFLIKAGDRVEIGNIRNYPHFIIKTHKKFDLCHIRKIKPGIPFPSLPNLHSYKKYYRDINKLSRQQLYNEYNKETDEKANKIMILRRRKMLKSLCNNRLEELDYNKSYMI